MMRRAILPILVTFAAICLARYFNIFSSSKYTSLSRNDVVAGRSTINAKRKSRNTNKQSIRTERPEDTGIGIRSASVDTRSKPPSNRPADGNRTRIDKHANIKSKTRPRPSPRPKPKPKLTKKKPQQSPTPKLPSPIKKKAKPPPPPIKKQKLIAAASKNETTSSIQQRHPPPIQIAWLMSFPNSGTSYTSKLIRTITNASTATNYGASTRDEYGCSRPISSAHRDTGPFWQSNTYSRLGGNDGEYLLTKTHCGGYCNGCGPSGYFETAASFRQACLMGKRSNRCRRDSEGNRIRVKKKKDTGEKSYDVVEYKASLVKRAVHVIRNPFDNVVSRFHLKARGLDNSGKLHFDLNKAGFRKWCTHIDGSFTEEEALFKAFSSRRSLLDKIPCHADFIRYVLWHHYAERTQAELKLPTLVLHYEDYFGNFNATVSKLMSFLHIKAIKNAPEKFEVGKTYRDYFSSSEKAAVAKLAKSISSAETWERLKRYF